MRGKGVEEAKLEEAGGNVSVRTGDAIQTEIDQKIIESERLAPFGKRQRAPQEKFHAGNEVARAERLGDVMVGARLEGGDEIGFAAAGREHDNGQAVEHEILAELG